MIAGRHQTLSELQDIEDDFQSARKECFRIALLIPMCGSAGLWAPSCISSAQVAVAELNTTGGIRGKQVELIVIDSALEARKPVEHVVNTLIDAGSIDAIVGMHISAVRQTLSKIIQQRVPYVYTPLYEGGEKTKGVFAIGDTPERQLGPALAYFKARRNITSWALIGNDYVWPRASHDFARHKLDDLGACIMYERYLPFGACDMREEVAKLSQSGAQAVLISLVGQDAIAFNRAFGAQGLHSRMLRFSCAIEENALLACGEENLVELYSAASYFATLNTAENNVFKEKYYQLHGETAPMLNALGQSTYEGVHFLSGLMKPQGQDWKSQSFTLDLPVEYKSIRRKKHPTKRGHQMPVYLAKANGMLFDIIKEL